MIIIGDKVCFDPFREIRGFGAESNRGKMVTGTVVMVNYEHRWFSAEYECGGVKMRESFNFWDIGKAVNICG